MRVEQTILPPKENIMLSEKDISFILNSALASAKIERLILPHMEMRPQIHTLIHGEIGTGKSSILVRIGKVRNIVPVISLNKSHIQGSVDSDYKDFVEPIIWEHRRDCVLMDEFYLGIKNHQARESLTTLLSLMENPHHKKKIGYRCNEVNINEPDGLYCHVKNNTIEFKTRFVLIANTMMDIYKTKMQEMDALISRCVCIPFYPTMKQLEDFASGDIKFFIYQDYKVKNKVVRISKKEYDKIRAIVKEYKVPKTKYLRTIGDLCRFYAVHGKILDEEFRKVMELSAYTPDSSL